MHSGVAVYEAVDNGKEFIFLYHNRSGERISGIPHEKVIGHNVREVFSSIEKMGLLDVFRRVWQTGRSETHPTSQYQDERLTRWVENEVFKLRSGEIVAIYNDVTKQKQAEQSLRLSEVRYRTLVETVPSGIEEIDLKGNLLFTSSTYARMMGYHQEELKGMNLSDLLPDDEQERVMGDIYELIEQQPETTPYFHRFLRKDGRAFPAQVDWSYKRDVDGQVIGFIAIISDITERNQEQEELLTQGEIITNMAEGAFLIRTSDATIVYANPKFEQMFGYHHGEILGKHVSVVNAPTAKSPEATANEINNALMEKGVWSGEVKNIKKDGTPFWCYINVSTFNHPSYGEVWVSVHSDITKRKEAEAHQRLAAQVIESTQEGVLITDAELRIVSINPAFEQLTGYSANEAVGQTPRLLISGYHDADFYRRLWQQLIESGGWQGEIWNRRKSGEIFPEWLNISCIQDEKGVVSHYIGVFSDLSTQKHVQERLRNLAYYDVLTKLPNRQLFQDRLKMSLAHAQREGSRLAVMFIDADRFKAINDSLGHSIGDKVLQEIARRLTEVLRQEDTISRLGGDEFTIIAPGIDHAESAAHIASKLLETSRQSLNIDQHTLHLTLSIGISIYPDDATEEEELLRQADTAMFRAKEAGGGRFQFYEPEMGARSLERLALEHELRMALKKDQLQLSYQPQVDLRNGQWLGIEALARWHHPALGWVPPDVFIPMAEEIGLIDEIGIWVLWQACLQHKVWLDAGLEPGYMAVNLSPVQLRQGELAGAIAHTLVEIGLDAKRLELEVTESIFMGNRQSTISVLQAIGDLGIDIAVDDFGTGYSSLSYLKLLPVDKLKIDLSFVKDLPEDAEDATITTTIIAMAKALGLRVIAEGVETEAQKEFLLKRGCDAMQGFLFSRAVSAKEIEEMLSMHDRPKA
jgi:diguanylate cyclase (GGDEF)-like protein/PAS domain S-box-containing protein